MGSTLIGQNPAPECRHSATTTTTTTRVIIWIPVKFPGHLHFHISGMYMCWEFYQLQSIYSIKSHMITYCCWGRQSWHIRYDTITCLGNWGKPTKSVKVVSYKNQTSMAQIHIRHANQSTTEEIFIQMNCYTSWYTKKRDGSACNRWQECEVTWNHAWWQALVFCIVTANTYILSTRSLYCTAVQMPIKLI